MPRFQQMVDKVIQRSDILLIVVDARDAHPFPELEHKIERAGKQHVYVLNKIDLHDASVHLPSAVHVSAKKHLGTIRLLRKIMELSKGKEATVGVIGYPNTGKSTLINALKGRHAAPTSPLSGFTRAVQKIRISRHVMLIDTPGVLPRNELPKRSDDPEQAVLEIIASSRGKIERHFGIAQHDDPLETLEAIARKKHMLKKGGEPDTDRIARQILRMIQDGKL